MTAELEAPTVTVVESAAGFSIRRDGAIRVLSIQPNGAASGRETSFPQELAFLRRTHGWTIEQAEQLVDVANELADASMELTLDAMHEAALEESDDEGRARYAVEPPEPLPEFLL